ncbi:hypothetical protein KW791_01595 [Candidatus Parcubacteria bacterium]|nr:hypothetical protein [Candidatus Parcubacteria bacterium]
MKIIFSVLTFCIVAFSVLKAGGLYELLQKNDTLFFFCGLLSIFFLVILWGAYYDKEVARVPSILFIFPLILSLVLLADASWNIEGYGIVMDNNHDLGYPASLTGKEKGLVLEVSEARKGFPFFMSRADTSDMNKVVIAYIHPERFSVGQKVKFRSFVFTAPTINAFAFLESDSPFSYITIK